MFDMLSNEILQHLFSLTTPNCLLALGSVSKLLNKLTSNDTLWRSLLLKTFPLSDYMEKRVHSLVIDHKCSWKTLYLERKHKKNFAEVLNAKVSIQ